MHSLRIQEGDFVEPLGLVPAVKLPARGSRCWGLHARGGVFRSPWKCARFCVCWNHEESGTRACLSHWWNNLKIPQKVAMKMNLVLLLSLHLIFVNVRGYQNAGDPDEPWIQETFLW